MSIITIRDRVAVILFLLLSHQSLEAANFSGGANGSETYPDFVLRVRYSFLQRWNPAFTEPALEEGAASDARYLRSTVRAYGRTINIPAKATQDGTLVPDQPIISIGTEKSNDSYTPSQNSLRSTITRTFRGANGFGSYESTSLTTVATLQTPTSVVNATQELRSNAREEGDEETIREADVSFSSIAQFDVASKQAAFTGGGTNTVVVNGESKVSGVLSVNPMNGSISAIGMEFTGFPIHYPWIGSIWSTWGIYRRGSARFGNTSIGESDSPDTSWIDNEWIFRGYLFLFDRYTPEQFRTDSQLLLPPVPKVDLPVAMNGDDEHALERQSSLDTWNEPGNSVFTKVDGRRFVRHAESLSFKDFVMNGPVWVGRSYEDAGAEIHISKGEYWFEGKPANETQLTWLEVHTLSSGYSSYLQPGQRPSFIGVPSRIESRKDMLSSSTHKSKPNKVELSSGEESVDVYLMPVQINSVDRFLAGAIPESLIDSMGGIQNVGLVFRHKTSGERHEFPQLSEAFIYDDPHNSDPEGEDKFLSNAEIALGYNGQLDSPQLSQNVVLYREDGMLHFRALFDAIGDIEVGIIVGGTEVGAIEWTLVSDLEIGHLAETIDSILSGTWGTSTPPLAMRMTTSGSNTISSSLSPTVFQGFFAARSLTIKVLMPLWDKHKERFVAGARRAGAATARALQMAAFGGKGFCEGAWMGIVDDATSLGELVTMISNPAETAKTFRDGFKVLMKLDVNGWKNVGKTLVKSFLDTGVSGVDDWVEPNNVDVAAYLVGYTSGFIAEQIAVSYITAGVLKAGNIGAKISSFIRNAAKGIVTSLHDTVDLVRKRAMIIKNSIFRRFSQDALSEEDVRVFKRLLEKMQVDGCPNL